MSVWEMKCPHGKSAWTVCVLCLEERANTAESALAAMTAEREKWVLALQKKVDELHETFKERDTLRRENEALEQVRIKALEFLEASPTPRSDEVANAMTWLQLGKKSALKGVA